MNFKKNYKAIVIFIFLIWITFLASQKNTLGTAPDDFYRNFQHESESLVLGKIITDKYHKQMPKRANLGYASILDFKYEPGYLSQSYSIINDNKIEDYLLSLENINDENWSHGIARKFTGIVVKDDNRLTNYLGKAIFLKDDEYRTIIRIDHSGIYANIYLTGSIIDPSSIEPSTAIKLSGERLDSNLINLTDYFSQYGIQGIIFSKIYNNLKVSVDTLYRINSLLFSIVVAALIFIYKKIISIDFAIIFFLTVIFSPWLVSFAKNLYWVPFTWFFPAIFAGYYFLAKSTKHRIFAVLLIYFSFLLKCLAGYEYISSIILLAAAIFLYELFNPDRILTKSQSVKGFFIICLIGVAGFLTALLMHAGIRADNVLDGIKSIYEFDVKRRTYGDPKVFGVQNYAALSASPWGVVKTYIFTWDTKFLKGISGSAFPVLLVLSIITIIYRYCASHQNKAKDLGLFLAFLLPPLSWFILAKSHSAQHTHLNYVLWYFGFAAGILYLTLNGIKIAIAHIVYWANAVNLGKI